MKRFLLLTLDFPPRRGGVARYLDALATILRGDIRVVAEPESGDSLFDRSAPYPVERRSLLFRFLWPRWKKSVLLLLMRCRQYRVVLVSHVLPLGVAAWVASWFTRRPYVVFLHGMDVGMAKKNPLKRWLVQRVLRAAALVVTNSQALEREVREDFGAHRSTVVYPCLATPVTGSRSMRAQDAPVTFLTVARLVPRKGHLRVLDALHDLLHMKQIGSVRYHIVGDGPMLASIRDRVREFGLEEIVCIDCELDDAGVQRAYAAADIFVMPTVQDEQDREGFGTVYLEAAAFGIPSIATQQPGVDEAVLDGQTGLLVSDGDIPALARAMQELASDAHLCETLGARAKERVLGEFTCDRQFETLKMILQDL